MFYYFLLVNVAKREVLIKIPMGYGIFFNILIELTTAEVNKEN